MFDDTIPHYGSPPAAGDAFAELWSRRIGRHAPAELRQAVIDVAWSLNCATGYNETDSHAIVHALRRFADVCELHRETLDALAFLGEHARKKAPGENVETVQLQGVLL